MFLVQRHTLKTVLVPHCKYIFPEQVNLFALFLTFCMQHNYFKEKTFLLLVLQSS